MPKTENTAREFFELDEGWEKYCANLKKEIERREGAFKYLNGGQLSLLKADMRKGWR